METFFGLLALSGLFVALEAAPAEKPRKPLVVANAMPKLGPNTFNFMIGACSYKEIVYDTDDCQRRFYMSYRTSPNMPCGKRFAPLQKCVLEKHKSCLKSVLSSSRLQKAMEMYRKSMDLTRKFSCGLKRWKISEYLKGDETCSAGFGEKVDQCASKYLDVLFKTPGSLELCGLHDQYQRCLLATINKMCDFDFSNSSWIFGSKVNPFCDDKQRKALDVQNDDDHNHDDHDAHDHGHDHDHDGDHDADDHDAHDHDHDHRRKRSLSGADVGGCSYVLCSLFGFVL